MRLEHRFLLVILAGALFALAIQGTSWLVWFCFIPFFVAVLAAENVWEYFCYPALFCLLWYVFGLGWFYAYQEAIFFIGLVYVLLFYLVLGFGLYAFRERMPLYISAPLVYALLFGVFGLLPLGNMLFAFGVFTEGLFLSSAVLHVLLLFLQAAIAFVLFNRRWNKQLTLLVPFLLLIVFLSFTSSFDANEEVDVVLVQGNFPETWQWRQAHVPEILSTYSALTLEQNASLVVWPEYSIPLNLDEHPEILSQVTEVAQQADTHILFGAMYEEYNTAFLVGPKGLKQMYRARQPFPFDKGVPGSLDDNFFVTDFGNFRVALCYEELFASFFGDADFYVVMANNQWLPHERAQEVTSLLSRVHVLRTGNPLLRVTNNGVTEVLSGRGSVVASLPLNETGMLQGTVSFKKSRAQGSV